MKSKELKSWCLRMMGDQDGVTVLTETTLAEVLGHIAPGQRRTLAATIRGRSIETTVHCRVPTGYLLNPINRLPCTEIEVAASEAGTLLIHYLLAMGAIGEKWEIRSKDLVEAGRKNRLYVTRYNAHYRRTLPRAEYKLETFLQCVHKVGFTLFGACRFQVGKAIHGNLVMAFPLGENRLLTVAGGGEE